MTEREATAEADRLNREHPDRNAYRWVARPTGDEWQVVRLHVPDRLGREGLVETTEEGERPPQADDPRPAHQRNAPGAWG